MHVTIVTQLRVEDVLMRACMNAVVVAVQAQFRERLLEINIDTQKADRSMIPAAF